MPKPKIAFCELPMMNEEAARYVAHTHPLTQQSNEKPEDFVLRIVRAYDEIKSWKKHGGK